MDRRLASRLTAGSRVEWNAYPEWGVGTVVDLHPQPPEGEVRGRFVAIAYSDGSVCEVWTDDLRLLDEPSTEDSSVR